MKKFLTLIIFLLFFFTGCAPRPSDIPSPLNPPASMPETTSALRLQVTGYENGASMPAKYATVQGGGENISIGLQWQAVDGAKSYALLFDDIHPVANNWVHWLVVDIPAGVTEIPERASRVSMPAGSRELITSWGQTGYDGPQPPVGSGNHEYVARLYALNVEKLDVPEKISRADFLSAVQPHALAEESYSGFFER